MYTSLNFPAMSSRKSASGWTTTISLQLLGKEKNDSEGDIYENMDSKKQQKQQETSFTLVVF